MNNPQGHTHSPAGVLRKVPCAHGELLVRCKAALFEVTKVSSRGMARGKNADIGLETEAMEGEGQRGGLQVRNVESGLG